MNIKKYFDLNFLNDVSKDAELLQGLCDEDNGFIFQKLKDFEIYPEKEIVEKVDSFAAIIFLFENYKVKDEDYVKYSSFFRSNSPIMRFANKNHPMSKDVFIKLFFEYESFISPGFLFTKDDFIKYENLFINKKLSLEKNQYIFDSSVFISHEDIKEIPLSIFEKNERLYSHSSMYLFDDSKHLRNYEKILFSKTDNCDYITFIEYVKRGDNLSLFENISHAYHTEANIKEIYFILKKRDLNFTINKIFPYVCGSAKLEIIKKDYTGDFNSQILVDTYLNNKNKLEKDFGSNYSVDFKNVNLPPLLKHFISLISCLNTQQYGASQNKITVVEDLVKLLKDYEKTRLIDLTQIPSAQTTLNSLYQDSTFGYYEKSNRRVKIFLPKELVTEVITLFYNQVFENNNLIGYPGISWDMFNSIYKNTTQNLNKFIWFSSLLEPKSKFSENYMIKDGIKLLPLEFQNDLLLLIEKKPISLDSTLFKADCALNMTHINSVQYLNKNHLKVLPENTIIYYINQGVLLEDETWSLTLKDFNSGYSFPNFQLSYFKKNSKNKDNGPILLDLIKKIKNEHDDAYSIFGEDVKFNDFVSNSLNACSDKIDYIKKNRDKYIKAEMNPENNDFYKEEKLIKLEKEIKKIRFYNLSEDHKNKFIALIKPKSFFEAKIIYEATSIEEIFFNYILSQIKMEENKRDLVLSMVTNKFLLDLIKPDFLNNQDIITKENIFIFVAQNIKYNDFYNILKLIDFNNPDDDMQQRIKNHIIKNQPDKLIYNPKKLNEEWKYNMEDLYQIFKRLDENSSWSIRTSNTNLFSDCVKFAIRNSSSDMFWEVLERAKNNEPAIYSVLASPISMYNEMILDTGVLTDSFNIFNKKRLHENPEKPANLNPYIYIYECIDLNVVANGINAIRESFSRNFEKKDSSERDKYTDNLNKNIFSSLSQIHERSDYIGQEKINLLVDKLLDLNISNLNIIISFDGLVMKYGKNKLAQSVLEKINSVQDINSVFLKELSSTNYKENDKTEQIVLYSTQEYSIHLKDVKSLFYEDLFESFVRLRIENALFISFLYSQVDRFSYNFIENEKVDFRGSFNALNYLVGTNFGSNIRNFTEDFFNSSKLYEEIDDIKIGEINEKPLNIKNDGFKI